MGDMGMRSTMGGVGMNTMMGGAGQSHMGFKHTMYVAADKGKALLDGDNETCVRAHNARPLIQALLDHARGSVNRELATASADCLMYVDDSAERCGLLNQTWRQKQKY